MKKMIKNSIWGIVSQLVTVLFSIVLQKIFIDQLGIEYQGLNSVMTSLISVLSLAELGIGTAIIFSLYEPIAQKDEKQIASLINAYKKLYLAVALLIIIIGFLCIPFLKFFIKDTNFENGYIRIVLILFVIRTSASYIGAEYSSLLFADQKSHVSLCIKVFMDCFSQTVQICVILFTRNFLLQLVVSILATAINNIITMHKAKSLYPFLKLIKPEVISLVDIRRFISDVKELSISKLADILIFQTDSLLLAFFYNEVVVGMYSNYMLVVQGINAFINRICQGIQPTIVSYVVSRKKEKQDFFKLFKIYYILLVNVGSCICCCCILLLQDFVAIYFGSDYLLTNQFVYFAVIAQYCLWIAQPIWLMCYSNGLFKEIKYTGIMVACINIIGSCLLTMRYREVGIILGTVICYVASNIIYIIIVYCKKIVARKEIKKYACYFGMGCISISMLLLGMERINIIVNDFIDNIGLKIIIKVIVGIVLPILYNILVFGRTEYALETIAFIKGYLKGNKAGELYI